MQRNANYCRIDFIVKSVELKEGKKGPWAKVQGYYEAEDRDGNTLEVGVRFTAFGVVAERVATVKEGELVRAELEMGGWKNDKGYTNPDYTCVSVSRPWPTQGEHRTHGGDGMKRGAAPPPAVEDDSLPF